MLRASLSRDQKSWFRGNMENSLGTSDKKIFILKGKASTNTRNGTYGFTL